MLPKILPRTLICLSLLVATSCADATDAPQLVQTPPPGTTAENTSSTSGGQVELVGVADGGGWVVTPEPDKPDADNEDAVDVTQPDAGPQPDADVGLPDVDDEDTDAGAGVEVEQDDATQDTGSSACQEASDCTGVEGQGPCAAWRCTPAGQCVLDTKPDGESCDDGDTCTSDGVCDAGSCLAGGPVDCDDGDACTVDTCVAESGCVFSPLVCDDGLACTTDTCVGESGCTFVPVVCDQPEGACETAACVESEGGCVVKEVADGASCEDGDPCTGQDTCEGGICGGTPSCDCESDVDCLDGADLCAGTPVCEDNVCTVKPDSAVVCAGSLGPCLTEQCNPATGECGLVEASLGAPCDAGPCQQVGACLIGDCLAAPISCDDDNPCTTDSCDELTGGCLNTPSDGVDCDDGNPCTEGDTCGDGTCQPGAEGVCDCQVDADCLDGWNPCNGTPICDLETNTCQVLAGSEVICEGGDTCAPNTCDPVDGSCKPTPVADETFCDDGSLCTQGDQCQSGVCEPGADKVCEDGDACTTDGCNADTGCVHVPSAPCDDEDACTVDTCKSDQGCVFDPIPPCDDDNLCTVDSCDPASGCVFTEAPACDDNDLCTADSCVATEGCVYAPLPPCDDGDACTSDTCDPELGCQSKPSEACDDGDVCTADTCDAASGCVFTPKAPCNDDNACTEDTCDATSGCVFTPSPPCDDGDVCTADSCEPETGCVFVQNAPCDDGDACTEDTCDPEVGCVFTANTACDDGDACTTDSCDPSTGDCIVVQLPPCDDGDACTSDGCDPEDGCVFTPKVCPASFEPCKVSSCDPASGCLIEDAEEGASCADGDACTTDDRCQSGICKGDALVCDPLGPCVDVGCVEGECLSTALDEGTSCDDNDACTESDSCQGGVCQGADITCDDDEVCTSDSCVGGVCTFVAVPAGTDCDDGSVCTEDDRCAGGTCGGAVELDCDDNDPCTTDSCDPITGCANTPDPSCPDPEQCIDEPTGLACDDGKETTVADICMNDVCAGFSLLALDASSLGFVGTQNVSATHVHQAEDGVWTIAVDGETSGPTSTTSHALVDVSDPGSPSVYENTKTAPGFVALHGRHAATRDGNIWYRFGVEWESLTPYTDETLFSNPALIDDIWSFRYEEPDSDEYYELLWMVGSEMNGNTGQPIDEAHIRFCLMHVWQPALNIADVTCIDQRFQEPFASDGTMPRAVSGTPVDEAFAGQVTNFTDEHRMVIATDQAAGGGGSFFYNDAFESPNGTSLFWQNVFFDEGAQQQSVMDTAVASNKAALTVGTGGHMRFRSEGDAGSWGYVIEVIVNQYQRDFSGVWVSGDAWFVSATRTRPNGNIDVELWVCPLDANPAFGSNWRRHTLASGSAAVPVRLTDVWGDEPSGTLYAVGAGVVGGDSEEQALVFVRDP